MMKSYMKKPIAITAVQYTGDNRDEILEFTSAANVTFEDENGKKKAIIHTLEGNMEATPGCYVVKGPRGEFYPVQQDIFEETYEEVYDWPFS